MIAYTVYNSGNANISVCDPAKEDSRELLEPRNRQIYWGMAWSPDGRWIAFKGVTPTGKELAVVNVGGQPRGFRVLVTEGKAGVKDILENVSWSPDSKQLLAGLITQTQPARQLYLVDVEGKVPPKLFAGQRIGRWYNAVAWSLDGKRILFSSPRESP
jgi:Tol biopolymer transport system component